MNGWGGHRRIFCLGCRLFTNDRAGRFGLIVLWRGQEDYAALEQPTGAAPFYPEFREDVAGRYRMSLTDSRWWVAERLP